VTTKKRAVPKSVELRFKVAFEWHARLCIFYKPVLPGMQWLFRVWYAADPRNEFMYDEIQAIFMRHARRQLGIAPDGGDWIISDASVLMKELTMLIQRCCRRGGQLNQAARARPIPTSTPTAKPPRCRGC